MPTTTTLIANLTPLLHSDSIANAVFWTNAECVAWLDEAVKRLARSFCVLVVRDTSISTANGTAKYTLPTRHISTVHVAVDNKPLRAATTHELVARDGSFETTAAGANGPTHWYQDKITIDQIGFYPVPIATKTVAIIHTQFPATVTDGANIDVPAVIGDYLEYWVLREAYNKESDARLVECAQQLGEVLGLLDREFAAMWGQNV